MNSSSTERSSASATTLKYIYDLPFFDRKEICRIFDENSQWETLGGGLMGYSSSELSEFGRVLYRGGSPTDALLTSWGNQNHTLLELFTLCARLYNGRAMKVLAKYVDPKYHAYMPDDTDFHATQLLVALDPPKLHQPIPEMVNSPKKKIINVDDKNGGGADRGAADGKMGAAGHGAKPAKPADALSSSVGLLPPIAYAELTAATSGWDKRNMLGKGGFGTVYKGNWKNTAVAIKRMEHRPNEAYVESQMKQSLGEMRFLNSYRHDNILPLYGYCLDGPHPCLVYQFMTNGSLEDRILCRQRTPPLSWHLRFHMAKGVACGIQFLHSIGPQPLIHGDIKSANILLDRNFEAKVGDFGLAREMTTPGGAGLNASYVKVSRVHGTRPYLPDEYLRSKKLSTKVDTYSFGIVLFELATGLRAYEEQRQKKFLKDMVEEFEGITDKLKDAKGGGDNPDVFPVLVNLGRHCTERLAKKRPEMVEVLKSLEAAMPYATSSIRTLSTHVTGLPYLFELPISRPGSLGIPPHTSYMTNRNNEE
ncbi:pelle-like serine/threonine-protein kinase pik-1 isoform X2 [Folsomia candida]|uniref:pelle-like serine/threonine-protein kinase pik-1 isoform X2 n=1 Tax=Folsomia candida TaxID=158441 RepID=UPI001604D944|nr:pelle-like serine/threonine-protein kinase pik-1 isoform X2 [Folsomia candida]